MVQYFGRAPTQITTEFAVIAGAGLFICAVLLPRRRSPGAFAVMALGAALVLSGVARDHRGISFAEAYMTRALTR